MNTLRFAVASVAASLSLGAAAQSGPIIDPPAADNTQTGFFEKASEFRPAPKGLPKACGSMLVRAAKFLMKDVGIDGNAIRDEKGRKVPPYIYHAVIDDNDRFGYRVAYPAYHHAYLIEAFLDYYNYSGDTDALRRARQLGDWLIEHSTPADWKMPFLPWSTFTEGKPGGFEDKENLQPDKVGYAGLSYTRLYEVTGKRAYLDAAIRAAKTLAKSQNYDGSWPFRVNPQTGAVAQPYSSAIYMNVAFMEKMYDLTGNRDFKNSQIIAWMWMLRNPVRTNNWSGLYEDIPVGSDSQVHYSPLQTIRLLLRYSTPVNRSSYVDKARKLFDWTMDGLAFDDRRLGLLVREQTGYPAATPSATMNWSMMAAEFYLATGDAKYRQTTLEALRMVTRYGLKPDGRTHNTVLGGDIYGNYGSWYSLTSPVVRYVYQDMGCLPELSPDGETHLLRTSTQVGSIRYSLNGVAYETLRNSVDLLKLARAPRTVVAGGKVLPVSRRLPQRDGCSYNPESRVLVVRHASPDVRIVLKP